MNQETRPSFTTNSRAAKIRAEVDRWLKKFDGKLSHFITLTFDAKKIDDLISRMPSYRQRNDERLVAMYSRSMRHFGKRLQRALYGNMASKRRSPFLFVPILEGLKENQVPHFHCYAYVSSDRYDILEAAIVECWSKVQFFGFEYKIEDYRSDGCLIYGAKNATSLDRENVDWMNVILPK